MLETISLALSHTVEGWNCLAMVCGAAWGIIGGALPGITGAVSVALILPFTFGMSPSMSLALLVSCYTGAMFGGSISSIMLGAPGTASAAATLLDGRELYKKGYGGLAVGVALASSVLGGLFGSLVLIFFCTPLANLALLFGPPEYFILGVFGVSIIASLSKDKTRGFIAGLVGMMVATIGIDQFTGLERFTGGYIELLNGVEFLPVLIGVFALTEMIMQSSAEGPAATEPEALLPKVRTQLPSLKMLFKLRWSILIGSLSGTIIGIMPGAGGNIASWFAYSQAKQFSKTPEEFGHGSMEGIAAPEAANNASEGGALIPMLALGIPGSNTTAIMLGALTLQGLNPGPVLFSEHPEIVHTVYGTAFLSNFMVMLLGMIIIKPMLRVSMVKTRYCVTCIMLLICTAAFSIQTNIFDVWVALFFGLVGIIMKRFNFSVAAFVLGMILGPILEVSLQRSLVLSRGDFSIFFTRPICMGLLAITVASFIFPYLSAYLKQRRQTA